MNSNIWRCPLCQESLQLVERSFVCSNRHSFDRAKEGYVNLLPVNKKKSTDPGDSKAMLDSRRRFLQQGFYQPLADVLVAQIQAHYPVADQVLQVFDAGCGEGYYLGQLAQALGERAQFAGTDIAKPAMRMAAKRYPQLQFAVASSFDLPVADNSVDVLVRVFAPAADSEIVRVLKPGGLYLWANPATHHLFELRQLVYDTPQLHTVDENKVSTELGLQALPAQQVNYQVCLPDAAAIGDLLEMTPYYWSASAEKQAQCRALQQLELTVDFHLSAFVKR